MGTNLAKIVSKDTRTTSMDIGLVSFLFSFSKYKFTDMIFINPLSANYTKWSNTLKQPTNYLSVFDNFLGLVFKRLMLRIIFVGHFI